MSFCSDDRNYWPYQPGLVYFHTVLSPYCFVNLCTDHADKSYPDVSIWLFSCQLFEGISCIFGNLYTVYWCKEGSRSRPSSLDKFQRRSLSDLAEILSFLFNLRLVNRYRYYTHSLFHAGPSHVCHFAILTCDLIRKIYKTHASFKAIWRELLIRSPSMYIFLNFFSIFAINRKSIENR